MVLDKESEKAMGGGKVLTVSIAGYNISSTLEECLSHFTRCRNLSNLEVIIVDDGSSDNTAELASKYVDKRPDVFKLIKKANGGWGSTINSGIQVASGTYFKQLDGDDYYDEDNLDRFISFLDKCRADIVITPFCHYEESTGAITRYAGIDSDFISESEIPIEELPDLYPPAMHSVAVRTSILKENNITITEHCFYTDVEFVLKSLNYANTVQFYDLPIYYYRLGRDGQSMSIAGVQKHYKDHEKMVLGMWKYINEKSTSELKKKIMSARVKAATMYMYKFFMALSHTRKHKEELRDFDIKLRKVAPDYYNCDYGLPVRFFRKHNFAFYGLISTIKNRQDRKQEVFLYER